MHRYRVAVLRGGQTSEFASSMQTGFFVLNNLDPSLFNPIDVVITKTGEWIVDGRVRDPEYIIHTSDVVFNALHGSSGESGELQRFIQRYGARYTGSDAYSSAISLHKIQTKNHLKQSELDVKFPQHLHVTRDSLGDLGRLSAKIIETFGPEYIIKPVSSTGSHGTMYVRNPLLLPQALKDALQVHEDVMVEARIPGREVTSGVIEKFRDKDIYTLPTVEFSIPEETGFLSHEMKQIKTVNASCPSGIDAETKQKIESLTREIHSLLGLSQYSRADYIIAKDGIYFLEINALPQLSDTSSFIQALSAVGSSHKEFVTHIVLTALGR